MSWCQCSGAPDKKLSKNFMWIWPWICYYSSCRLMSKLFLSLMTRMTWANKNSQHWSDIVTSQDKKWNWMNDKTHEASIKADLRLLLKHLFSNCLFSKEDLKPGKILVCQIPIFFLDEWCTQAGAELMWCGLTEWQEQFSTAIQGLVGSTAMSTTHRPGTHECTHTALHLLLHKKNIWPKQAAMGSMQMK